MLGYFVKLKASLANWPKIKCMRVSYCNADIDTALAINRFDAILSIHNYTYVILITLEVCALSPVQRVDLVCRLAVGEDLGRCLANRSSRSHVAIEPILHRQLCRSAMLD